MNELQSLVKEAKEAYDSKNLVKAASLVSRAASLVAYSDADHDQAFETIFRKIRNGQMR